MILKRLIKGQIIETDKEIVSKKENNILKIYAKKNTLIKKEYSITKIDE
jgi:hypothetical protein